MGNSGGSAYLVELETRVRVAILTEVGDGEEPVQRQEPFDGAVSGPNGLLSAVVAVDDEDTVRLAWRGVPSLSTDEVAQVLASLESLTLSHDTPPPELVAVQSPVQFPGIGSVPLAIGTRGTVQSFTSRNSAGDQRAVAIGSVVLCASFQPLELFRFWYGEGGGLEYLAPPSDVADGGEDLLIRYPSPSGVGSTSIYARDDRQGRLIAVGAWGLAAREVESVISTLVVSMVP